MTTSSSSSLSSSSSSSPTISEQQIPKWHIKAQYVETCNCDYGCPVTLMAFRQVVFAERWYYTTSNQEIMEM
jgi:hypothetical protein